MSVLINCWFLINTYVKQVALLWQRDRATRLSVEILQNNKISLSYGIICVILRLAVFTQYQSVTDTHRNGQTDT